MYQILKGFENVNFNTTLLPREDKIKTKYGWSFVAHLLYGGEEVMLHLC